jgi:hypothetical protein
MDGWMDDGEGSTFACMKLASRLQKAPLIALLPDEDKDHVQRQFFQQVRYALDGARSSN